MYMRGFGTRLLAAILGLCFVAASVRAQDLPTTNPGYSSAADANGPDVDDTSPILTTHGTWAGAMVIIVVGLFFAAAVIGPVVRAESPRTIPPAFSHHEDPSHHTGREPDTVPLPHEHGPGGGPAGGSVE